MRIISVLRRRGRGESGSVIVTAAVSAAALMGFMALALDLGYLEQRRRVVQTAADAGAVAGAQELDRLSSDLAVSAAQEGAASNGFTNGVNGVTVTVNNPPASGSRAGDPRFIEVIVGQNQPTFFAKMLNFSSAMVRARAVAGLVSSPNCIYVLDRNVGGALTVTGSTTVNVNCGVVVDSSAANALSAGGAGTLIASSIAITGGYTEGGIPITPTPQTGVPPEGDPLAYLRPPAFGGCDYNDYNFSGAAVTLSPGVYCGGITLSGPGVVQFNAGIYILNGGGLKISGKTTVLGDGVMFYNTFGAGAYGPIDISGTPLIRLSAPTTEPYKGILFFADRSAPTTVADSFLGTAGSLFEGALYFPSEPLQYSGDTLGASSYTTIVSRTLTFTGNSTVQANYTSLAPDGSPLKQPTLVE